MAILISPDQINLSALTIPAVYLVVQPPQASITGAPASVIGQVGTASWGPVNIPTLVGDLNVENSTFKCDDMGEYNRANALKNLPSSMR